MYNYCTLFDSNYITRGLAMYHSLAEHAKEFHLYVFAFNDLCHVTLTKLNLRNMTVISLEEFETDELKEIKKTRSAGEYCWTCTPSVIKYSIEKFNLHHCTYLDADLMFYSDPSVLIEEMGDKQVSISEHRYSKQYIKHRVNGTYCVQFMTFKNSEKGLAVLEWWRQACNNWCYARIEDGKFGDQLYLEDWTSRFDGVHVIENEGCGLAPWNIQQYAGNRKNLMNRLTKKSVNPVFYHFHNFRVFNTNIGYLGFYHLRSDIRLNFYDHYIEALKIQNSVVSTLTHVDCNANSKLSVFGRLVMSLKRLLRTGNTNFIKINWN